MHLDYLKYITVIDRKIVVNLLVELKWLDDFVSRYYLQTFLIL